MQFSLINSSEIDRQKLDVTGVLTVMPFTQPIQAQRAAELMAQRAGIEGLVLGVYDACHEGYVKIINQVFQRSHSEWFCYVAQDAFAGRHWLALAIHTLKQKQGKLFAFNDGKWHGQLAAFGVANREWITQLYGNHFFFDGYHQHYADTELTLIALQQQCLVYNPESLLIEVDWNKDNVCVNPQDQALFFKRASHYFDGKVTNLSLLKKFGAVR